MFGLPKYVLASRFSAGKRVLLVCPTDETGARAVVDSGATEVLCVGATVTMPEGVQAREDGFPRLPLHDHSVDVVVVGEGALEISDSERETAVQEFRRVLRPDGRMIASAQMDDATAFECPLPPRRGLDFWTLEALLEGVFPSVQLFAQMAWQGIAVSPVVEDEEVAEFPISLDEGALSNDAPISHYLMVAGMEPLTDAVLHRCLLVALPETVLSLNRPPAPIPAGVEDELVSLRDALGVRAAKAASLQRTIRDLESQLTALRIRPQSEDPAMVQRLSETIEGQRLQLEGARSKHDALLREHVESQKSMTALRAFSERTSEELASVTDEHAVLKTAHETLERDLVATRAEHEDLSFELERARSELDVLERVTTDQEVALRDAAGREREHRHEWETARAEVVALRAGSEHLREARDELQREYDELIAIHQRTEQEAQRVREELRVAERRNHDRALEYEARLEETAYLKACLEDAQRSLSEREEEAFRLRTARTSTRELAGSEDFLERLRHDREVLRGGIRARQEALNEAEREALEHRMEAARMRIQAERTRREMARTELELSRVQLLVPTRAGRGSDHEGEASKASQEALERALVSMRESDANYDQLAVEVEEARARVRELEETVGALETERSRLEHEVTRRAGREEVLAKLVEELSGEEDVPPAQEADAVASGKVGDDGLPEHWPEAARKRVRRLERKLKFGVDRSGPGVADAGTAALEARVRAAEQAHLIGILEAAEQTIWKLRDAAEQDEARYAARVTELRSEREMRATVADELEISRRLLASEQGRSIERERLLAEARASLAALRSHPGGSVGGETTGPPDARARTGVIPLIDLAAHAHVQEDSSTEPS